MRSWQPPQRNAAKYRRETPQSTAAGNAAKTLQPSLRRAEAVVRQRQAELERAQRDHARTVVRAPYDGTIQARKVNLHSTIDSSTVLFEIMSTDRVTIGASYLGIVQPKTRVRLRLRGLRDVIWEGE